MNGKTGGMQVDTKLVRELAEMLNETGLSEIEVEDGERKIKVSRTMTALPQRPCLCASSQRRSQLLPPRMRRLPLNRLFLPMRLKSPMVGTVYLSPEPGAAPFAAVGDKVAVGRHTADYRGDEGHEPDHRAQWRHGEGGSGRKRPTG